jgi:hypothetical protein
MAANEAVVAVLWRERDAALDVVNVQLISRDGDPIGEPLRLQASYITGAEIVFLGNNFVILWSDGSSIKKTAWVGITPSYTTKVLIPGSKILRAASQNDGYAFLWEWSTAVGGMDAIKLSFTQFDSTDTVGAQTRLSEAVSNIGFEGHVAAGHSAYGVTWQHVQGTIQRWRMFSFAPSSRRARPVRNGAADRLWPSFGAAPTFDGERFLLVWVNEPSGSGIGQRDVLARFIGANGVFEDETIEVATTPRDEENVAVAGSAGRSIILFTQLIEGSTQLFARAVDH